MILDDLGDFVKIPPFSLDKQEKEEFLTQMLLKLTEHHYLLCDSYRRIIDTLQVDIQKIQTYTDIPFLPVRLFKEFELRSIPSSSVVKTLTSSGTTGQQVSRIYLDRDTATNQTRILTKIVSSFIGPKRLPMIILDTSAVLKDRNLFSARGAGILGFSVFGNDKIYALDEHMKIDFDKINTFLEKHAGEKILLFGFTFMIWQYFYQELIKSNITLDLKNGILIHGGGWKKLIEESVDNETFKQSLYDCCGLKRISNFYGMVEQTGTVYMECEYGHLHAPVFSDIVIRDPFDFSIMPHGSEGLIEVVSVLPKSYPGHILLTEDLGVVQGEDDCPCGRSGKYFSVNGRIKNAELRGCSDTYATR